MRISNIIDSEKNNILFWLLFSYTIGITLYFSLYNEPSLNFIYLLLIIALLIPFIFRKSIAIGLMIIFLILGIIIPYGKTHLMDTKFFDPEPKFYKVTGQIDSILPGNKGMIVILNKIKLSDQITQYKKIRINIKSNMQGAKIGDIVSLNAMLYRPSNPVIQGGYDFARKAFFENISAVGYAVSWVTIITPTKTNSIEQIRYNITNQLVKELGNSLGGIASGLIVGEYSFINKKILEQIRIAGLTHLLSVSGMHISIIAMMFFIISRKFTLLLDNLNLYINSKKLSAIIAIIGSFLYLAISGYKIAAIRAFIMSSIYFLGIILDKFVISKRSVILAAFLILLIWPDNLIHPSFLMSFLAVIAIIITYDYIYEQNLFIHYNFIFKYIIFMTITSIVATIATLPIIVINFNNLSLYSVIANFIAVPLTSIYLMPCVILYFITYPFDLQIYIIKLIKPGLSVIEKISEYVSNLPYANIKISYIDHSLVYLMIIFITTCLFVRSKPLRLLMICLAILTAIYIPLSSKTVDLVINKKIEIALFKNQNNEMEFSTQKVPNWYKNAYLGYSGEEEVQHNPDIRISEFCCYGEYCAYSNNDQRLIIKVDNLFKVRKSLNGCDNFKDIYQNNHFLNLNEIAEGFYSSFDKDKITITRFEEVIGNRPWSITHK